ncbi:flagellar brake protein [Candidatus Nitrotoga sp. M5]|uniref:flagellar brake protein n=1 Tax=Candidatus Nitrotoga sp. M5 TaxID=2890409 RepID=UPI001EF46757|nr:flagellar brake protein [Candidatus Nitrotoga sp. M5]CAH1387769.1 Flagellar brake protein YcgR [Candidatus Nitrotoga sp. M5]
MAKEKEIPLKIELLSDGEKNEFRIHSKKEIQSILRAIAKKGSLAALYYEDGNDFILTTVLGVDEQNVWLDVSHSEADNLRILPSHKIIFISSHLQVKVQFVAHHIENTWFRNKQAFCLPMPNSLLYLQRRDYFRLLVPVKKPLTCVIPAKPGAPIIKCAPTIMDISVGGVALECEEHDTEFQPGKIYSVCNIQLPNIGTLTATILVKNIFIITMQNGEVKKRAGCEFIRLNGTMAILLQRYLTHLQSERLTQR